MDKEWRGDVTGQRFSLGTRFNWLFVVLNFHLGGILTRRPLVKMQEQPHDMMLDAIMHTIRLGKEQRRKAAAIINVNEDDLTVHLPYSRLPTPPLSAFEMRQLVKRCCVRLMAPSLPAPSLLSQLHARYREADWLHARILIVNAISQEKSTGGEARRLEAKNPHRRCELRRSSPTALRASTARLRSPTPNQSLSSLLAYMCEPIRRNRASYSTQ